MQTHDDHVVLTRDQARRIDDVAMNRFGFPGIVLMENASRGLALHCLHMLGWPKRAPSGRVMVLCGGGNNGGDGFAAARHLHVAKVPVLIVMTRPPEDYAGDALTNLNICKAIGLPMVEGADDPVAAVAGGGEFALILDGLLGTGLEGEVRGKLVDLIAYLNKQVTPILAIDTPSGLDCDTGQPLGAAVRADATASFVGLKKGFLEPGADAYTGKVVVTDIGVTPEVVRAALAE